MLRNSKIPEPLNSDIIMDLPSTLLRKTYANSNNKSRYAIQLAKVKTNSFNSFSTIQIIAKYRSHKSIKNSYVNRGLWRFKE